jgi:hypothetical protein
MTIGPVAGFAEADTTFAAALDGDRAGTGEGLNEGRGREAVAMVTEHDEQLWGQEVTGAGQGVKYRVVGVLAEELLGLADLESFVADQVKKELGQEDRFVLVGGDDDGVGLRSGQREMGVDIREKLGVGVVVGAAKGGEIGVGEGLSGLWGGVSDEEEEGGLGFDVAEEFEGLREVAKEDGLETVRVGGDGLGQRVNEAEFGLHCLHQLAVGFPGSKAVTVGAEEVGDEEGVGGVVVGAGGTVTATTGTDNAGGDDVDLIAAGEQEVDEEGVSGLEGDETIRRWGIQLGDLAFQFGEALGGVREGESRDWSTVFIHDTSIVNFFGPINTDQDAAHRIPPVTTHRWTRVSACLLRRSKAQRAFSSSLGSPGGRSAAGTRSAG